MDVSQKVNDSKGKSWKFWLIFIAAPIIVIICITFAFFYVYIARDVWKKRGLEKGLIFAKVHRNKEALEIFEKELAKKPEDPKVHYYMGVSYANLKEYDKAIVKLEAALKLKPDFSDAHIQLAIINLTKALEFRKLGKAESLVLEKLLEAEGICRAEIERSPNNKNAYTCLGEIHAAQGLIDDAIIDYGNALKLDNKLLNAHLAIARFYAQRDKVVQAEEHCNLVLSEIDHDNYEARMLLSLIYEQQGELEKAVECLKRILKKKPDNLTVHTQLGLLYLKMSKYDEAFEEVQEVHKINPVVLPPLADFIEGCVLFERKDYENAIVLLKKVTEKIPKFVQSHYVLAIALAERGQLEEAKAEFKFTLGLAPRFVTAQIGLMRLLEKDGNYNEIVRLSKEALAIEPGNLGAMQMLGNANVKLRDFKNAEVVFQEILKLKPSIGNLNMARLSLEAGQLGKCVHQCEQIINSNPEEAVAYDILGLAYLRQGKFDKAIEQFVKAIGKNQRMVDTHMNLTQAYIAIGRNKDAIKTLENLISIGPNNLRAKAILANLYVRSGSLDKSINTLVDVMAMDPAYLPGYKLASLYLLQDRADDAIDICNRALEIVPEDARFHLNLAVAHQENGDFAESILSCQEAGKLKPGMPFLDILMTNIHTANGDFDKAAGDFLKGNELFQKQDYTNAVTLLKEMTNRLPGSAQAHYILALALMESGGIKEAKVEFEAALDLSPGFIPAQLNLARLLFKSGGYRETIRLGKDILDLESGNLDVLSLIGKSYMKLRDFENAELIFQEIIKLNSLIGKTNMAHLSLVTGQLSKCIKECAQIIETEPEGLKVYDILGLAYVRQGDFDKGIEQFVKAIGGDKRRAGPHLNLAKAYVVTGRSKEAIKTLKDLLSFNPINLEANTILAYLYASDGSIDDAAVILERLLEIDPEYLPGYRLASLRLWQGRVEEAIDLCNMALKLAPEDAMLHIDLAIAYQQNEKYYKSISSFKKAGGLNSEMPFFDMFMSNIYVANGDFDKANKQVESSLMFNEEEKKEYLKFVDLCENNKKYASQVTLNLNRALAAKQMGDFDIAISECKKASEILPQSHIPTMLIEQRPDEVMSIYRNLTGPERGSVSIRLALARQLLKKGTVNNASKITEGVMELYPEKFSSYNLLRELLIRDTTSTSRDDSAADLLKMSQLNSESIEGYSGKVRLEFTNEQVESISIFNNEEKKEYLGLIKLCKNNEKKGKQVMLSINKYILAVQNGYSDLAIHECKKAANILPGNLIPKILLASAYLSANNKEEAIRTYDEIIERRPEYVSQDMGKAYLVAQKEEDAISTYKNLVDLDSNSVSLRLILAGLLFKNNSIEEAAKLVDEAIQLSPENLTAHNLLGELNFARASYENAEMAFSKVLQLNDSIFAGHYNMARLKFVQEEIDECIKWCKSGLQIKPVDIGILNILGSAYIKKAMLDKALLAFNKITDIDSDFVPAVLNTANIKLQLNSPSMAVQHYKAVLKIDPQNIVAHSGLGNAYALMGKHTDAIAEFEALRKAKPDNVNMYFPLIRSYLVLNEDDKAHEALMKVLELDPENQIARSLMAKIHVKNNEISEAIEQLKNVLLDNPEFADAYGLGILYLDKGEYDNSISIFKNGIEDLPNNVKRLCNLSVAYLINGDYEGARGVCSRALKINPDGFVPNLCMISIFLSKGEFEGAVGHLSSETSGLHNMQKNVLLGLINCCNNENEKAAKIGLHLSRSVVYANNKWLNRVIKEHDEIAKIALPDPSLYQTQAEILILAGGDATAIESCKKAVDLETNSPYAYYQLGGIYQRKARFDEAETFYKKLIAIDPDNTIVHLKLGIVLHSKGLINEAVKEYEVAIELDPASVFAINNLAYLCATKMPGKMDYAQKLAQKAKQLAPNNANILDTYGWICYLDGKYEKSISELKSAAKIAPQNPIIRYHLGAAYYKKDLKILALKELEYALGLSSTFPMAKEAGELIEKISFYSESNVLGF